MIIGFHEDRYLHSPLRQLPDLATKVHARHFATILLLHKVQRGLVLLSNRQGLLGVGIYLHIAPHPKQRRDGLGGRTVLEDEGHITTKLFGRRRSARFGYGAHVTAPPRKHRRAESPALPLHHQLLLIVGGEHLQVGAGRVGKVLPALLDPILGQLDQLLHLLVEPHGIVMEQSQPPDSGGEGHVDDVLHGGMPPGDLVLVLRGGVLRVVQEEVAPGDEVDVPVVRRPGRKDVAGGVPLGPHPHVVRLVVGDVAQRHLGLGILQAVAEGEAGMVQVVRRDADVAADLLAEGFGLGVAVAIILVLLIIVAIGINTARGGRRRRRRSLPPQVELALGEIVVPDVGPQVVEIDGEVIVLHLPGERIANTPGAAPGAVHVPRHAGDEQRDEERESLDMIPVRVGDEDVAAAVPGLAVGPAAEVLPDHVLAEAVGTGPHVQDDARSGRREEFHTGRRSAVLDHVGLRPGDGPAASPHLDGGGDGVGILLGVGFFGELDRRHFAEALWVWLVFLCMVIRNKDVRCL
mmetsp:Transcript_5577/g.15690  ORF Transcript_5577/g.15690 Transcript_5577/m.15690 type:complete len:520 (-) Transcript_5577:250-1809(-)